MKAPYLLYDTLDDRRELHRLLRRLSPARRLDFLSWCCQRAVVPNSPIHPGPAQKTRALAQQARWDDSADTRLSLDVFFDVWTLAIQYELDIDQALARLVALARQEG